jgi:ribokinase
VRKAARAFRGAAVLVLQLETPLRTVQAAAELASRASVRVILNPAPARALPTSLLKRVDLLTPNQSEAELLTGVAVTDEASAAKAADELQARGARDVIVTLGAQGAFVAGEDFRGFLPAYQVRAVDATAAGDVFNGALGVGMAEGKSLLDSARFANAAAAISVTRLGAQPSAPRRVEIEQVLRTGRVGRNGR